MRFSLIPMFLICHLTMVFYPCDLAHYPMKLMPHISHDPYVETWFLKLRKLNYPYKKTTAWKLCRNTDAHHITGLKLGFIECFAYEN